MLQKTNFKKVNLEYNDISFAYYIKSIFSHYKVKANDGKKKINLSDHYYIIDTSYSS